MLDRLGPFQLTALGDIRAAIERRRAERKAVPLIGRRKTMRVEVGYSAEQAIVAETSDQRLPGEIDGLPVVRTSEFPGWAVVER